MQIMDKNEKKHLQYTQDHKSTRTVQKWNLDMSFCFLNPKFRFLKPIFQSCDVGIVKGL